MREREREREREKVVTLHHLLGSLFYGYALFHLRLMIILESGAGSMKP